MRYLLILTLCLSCPAQAGLFSQPSSDPKAYAEILGTRYEGKNVSEFIEKNGLPTKQSALPNGVAVYEWVMKGSSHGTISKDDDGEYSVEHQAPQTCRTTLFTAADGSITKITASGQCLAH